MAEDAVETQVEGQKEVQDKATEGQLHAQNLQGQQSQDSRADLIQEVVQSDLDGTAGLQNLNARDFPLANLDDADVQEVRWMFEIYGHFDKIARPHRGSGMIGPFRVWASHGEADPAFPPDMAELNASDQYVLGNYTRATRGHQMAQQETTGKSIQESWLHDYDESASNIRDKLDR